MFLLHVYYPDHFQFKERSLKGSIECAVKYYMNLPTILGVRGEDLRGQLTIFLTFSYKYPATSLIIHEIATMGHKSVFMYIVGMYPEEFSLHSN